MVQQSDARLIISDGTTEIDLLDPGGGWTLEDPGWLPVLAALKGGGTFVDPALAEGRTLVHGEYGNVVESLPLTASGTDQARAVATYRDLQRLLRQAADYWRWPHARDPVWIEARPACAGCRTGYSLLYGGSLGQHGDPFRQPFYSRQELARLEGLALAVEREPFWRLLPPGQVLGPLLNLLKNPDFELWTQRPGAVADVEPDSWINLETTGGSGTNNRQGERVHSGRYCLRVDAVSVADAGRKGVYQVVDGVEDETAYTLVAWVKNASVQYGTGRILVTYGASQLEVYRRADQHGWKLYTGTFTTARDQTVIVTCEILGTGTGVVYAGAEGSVYFDSLMLLEGDWEDEAADGILPYMTSSHVVNHWDQPRAGATEAGDVNFVDVWDVPGDVDAPVRLELRNDTPATDWNAPVEVVHEARLGMRRTGDVFDFDNYHDPPGRADTSSSSDDRVVLSVGTEWVELTGQTVSGGALTPDNAGRFRLYARVKDMRASGAPTAELRLTYWIGAASVNAAELRSVPVPVAREWCVVDLTRYGAVNWDTRFQADEAASLGYKIEARRSTGTADLELDYLLRLPTDGGVVTAELDPPLTPDNSLVADCTAPAPAVQASAKRAGSIKLFWEDDTGGATSEVMALKSFQGELFIGGQITSGGAWHTRHWDGDEWRVLTHAYYVSALEEYDGRLYAGTSSGTVYRWTGSAWSLVAGFSAARVVALRAYAGRLYVLTRLGTLWSWDGTAWAHPTDLPLGGAGHCDYGRLAVYNNRLFLSQGTGGGAVYAWNGTAISLVGQVAGMTQVTALAAQGGYLWIGGDGPSVGRYDGSALTAETLTTGLSDTEAVYALGEYDGTVYAATTWTGGRAGRVYRRDAADDWAGVPKSRLAADYSARVLEVYDGVLYVGSVGYVANSEYADVLALASVDSWYKVADYRGSLFWAPCREGADGRRHRYVFSWDRAGYKNVADDRGLVSVGVVPRYFSLLGEG